MSSDMNLEDDEVTNRSGNRPFEDVLRTRISRRAAVAGGAATMAAVFLGTGPAEAASASRGGRNKDRGEVGFTPVPNAVASGPEPTISEDYDYQVLIPWGTPLQPGGPEFSWPQTSSADQEQQIGIGHDGMWFFGTGRDRGMLCINHEFGRTTHVLGKRLPESLEDVRIMQAAHGISVVKIEKSSKRSGSVWRVQASNKSRRITVNTPVKFSGPVAGSDLLKNDADNPTLGTLNNCANGYTPWGTYLTCEENFNGYFGTQDETWTPTPEQERYGFNSTGFGYAWHLFDPRFDLADPGHANEGNRFGWIVEVDPDRPRNQAMKRTALGRFKHEGCALTVGRGRRVVGYMGDDQRFDYIYKFVSAKNYRSMLGKGQSPLDEGQLYVARFDDDGTGEWLELTIDNPVLAAAFDSQEEILTYARIAGDLLGATPMDRPEWTSVAPTGEVFCTLTNNSRRTSPNPANPLVPNPDGHIIKWKDSDNHIGTTFEWEIVVLAQDTHGTEYQFGSPDGIWADPAGRVFIQTDGGQPDGQNNQMLVANRDGVIKRLFSGVAGDEVTGIAVTPDRKTMFINLQHPGNGDPSLTNFPAPTDGTTIPRDATIAIWRKDGGVVGS